MTEGKSLAMFLLSEIRETLASQTQLEDRERFCRLLGRSMAVLGLTDSDVADRLPVSRSAVTRWRNGNTAPLPMMRKPVYKFLDRKLVSLILQAAW